MVDHYLLLRSQGTSIFGGQQTIQSWRERLLDECVQSLGGAGGVGVAVVLY